MRKGTITTIALAIGVLTIAVPILTALYLARRQSLEEETGQALTMAGEVLRRTEAITAQAWAAQNRLRAEASPGPCSDSNIALMRDIDVGSSYLQIVGHVVDDRLVCSSLGRHGQGIPLGPVEYVSVLGAGVRNSVDLGMGDGTRFVVAEKDGVAIAVHRDVAIDVFVDRPDIALGVFGLSSGRRLIGRGAFKPSWSAALHDAPQVAFFDGDHVVGIRRSQRYDVAAYAAMPASYLQARVREFAAVLVPIGLALGAGLAFALLHLARQKASLPAMLRTALKKREFVLHYQPIVELRTRRMVGVEALLRWPRRDGSSVFPDVFIAAAEGCGLIQRVTRYVLENVVDDATRLLERWPDLYISINLSSADLHSDAVVGLLQKLIDKPRIHPRNIVVEATEHSFLDPQIAMRIVNDIRSLGIRVAIDDFGTGFSSLSYLTSLRTDYLKIDKTFVETVGTDSATSEVALHIIRVAESLGLKVIAEGVETEMQAAFLQAHGVEYAQGWLFCKAMPLAQLLRQDIAAQPTTQARPVALGNE